ncbi:DUF4328 domain-containing protein [Micromonospora sp. H33]|uniref:DUF4328 domain-containing protein n=1 Tax=Micromonospora sp. H33 TaxID=3452215 RepID=UPI003F8CD41B
MLCPTCDTDNDARTHECLTCRTPVGAPVLHPDVRVRPVRGIGRAAAVAVGATTLAHLLAVLIVPVQAAIAAEAGRRLDDDLILTAGLLDLVGVPYLPIFVTAGVLVIIWTWRARKNLDAFPGAGANLSAGWAIAGWLVPFVNLVVPYRVVANIARDSLWRLSTPGLVKIWWGAWVVFQLGEWCASRPSMRDYMALPETPRTAAEFQAYVDHYVAATGTGLPLAAVHVVAGVSLILLIIRISAAQEARIARTLPAGPILPGATVPAP